MTPEPATGIAGRLAALERVDLGLALRPRGAVVEVGDGVAQVVGLRRPGYEHLVRFDAGAQGMAYDLGTARTGVVLLSGADRVRAGDGCVLTHELPSVPVSPALLGRVIDPTGAPLDGHAAPLGTPRAVFQPAPELMARDHVRRPLITGVMVIDVAVPIGRGQRQLLIGDRNVGKTSLALDVVAAQRDTGVLCVYVIIGQPLSRILRIADRLERAGARGHTVVVAADAAQTPGLQYLAPYAGATIAESFRDAGRDVLVIYDDLTKHADAYRELALLLGRPPGREAFPGDIFYIHAELLERATAMSPAAGGGSVTALPIVETTGSDISAYIPTNLISITDGQVYLDAARFERNLRPAVDIGKSVSRIGGAAQSPTVRAAARNVRIDMARFEALEALTRVGLDVDPATLKALERGRRLRELFRQPPLSARPVAEQILAITAVARGWLNGLAPGEVRAAFWPAAARARAAAPELFERLAATGPPPEGWQDDLQRVFEVALTGSPR